MSSTSLESDDSSTGGLGFLTAFGFGGAFTLGAGGGASAFALGGLPRFLGAGRVGGAGTISLVTGTNSCSTTSVSFGSGVISGGWRSSPVVGISGSICPK